MWWILISKKNITYFRVCTHFIENIFSILFSKPQYEPLSLNSTFNLDVSEVIYRQFLNFIEDNKLSFTLLPLVNFNLDLAAYEIPKKTVEEMNKHNNLYKSFIQTCRMYNYENLRYLIIKSIRRFSYSSYSDYDFIMPIRMTL